MNPETTKKIQLALAAGVLIAGVRTAWIFYERRQDNAPVTKQDAPPLKADYYVTPKKLHPYDLKSAHELTQQPAWIREGYRFAYYPYNTASKRTDFAHESGTLAPIEKLDIKDVVTDITPGKSDQKQVMAVFQKDGSTYAFPIGVQQADHYTIYSDDMLFVQDPRELYKHWPADVWDAISKHEVKNGMNQLQADFSVGMG
ncbi:MAG TPA: hypothetical protein VLK33_05985, partial [Terriglobales bacterium]|nr:hypothetical protein [Terriglobales bacterium]